MHNMYPSDKMCIAHAYNMYCICIRLLAVNLLNQVHQVYQVHALENDGMMNERMREESRESRESRQFV